MTNFKYLQKMFFLLVMGFSMSLLCVACGDDEEDPINEEDVTPPSKDEDDVVTPPSEDVLEAVDLGLSVKWASCNVGATDVNLHGSYFAWGEIKEKEEYSEENSATYGKYFMNNIYGDAQYDAARAVWGGEWRLPTKYEMQELIENCAWTWTSEGIFNGYRVTSFRTGESIFLPAAGYKQGSSLSGANSSGIYWTSTPADSCASYVLDIDSDDNSLTAFVGTRYYGYSIRPVMGKPTLLYVPSLSRVRLPDYIVTALTVSATLGSDGGSPITERGFCISSTSEEPTTADRKVVSTFEGPDYSATIDGLAEGTTYYIRAYAVNAKGVGYGEARTFTTQTVELPCLSNVQLPDYIVTALTVSATLTDNGGDTLIVERGFCISSTSEEPTISDRKVVSTSEGLDFSAIVDELAEGTTYHIRAYAINAKGVGYGETRTFTTQMIDLPDLSDTEIEEREQTSVTVSATLEDNGGDTLVVERGFCISSSNEEPTISDRKVVVESEKDEFSTKIEGLEAGTIYYVRAYVINSKGLGYGEVASFATMIDLSDCYAVAVDLGLSVKWASCNVGASSPEQYGAYFAWGETTEKLSYDVYNSTTYGLSTSTLKSRGIIGSDGNLTASYDAATANWGSAWRMPTFDEIKELLNNCTWTWTTQNGVNGRKVTGPNGNSIFLPAAGGRYGTDLGDADSLGLYWSATPYGSSNYAFEFGFSSDIYSWDYFNRYFGCTVRPVLE